MIEHKPYELLIADDHPIFRRGLREIIEGHPDLKVVYEAIDGQEALDFVRTHPPDIAILDIDMPRMHGIEVAQKVLEEDIPVHIMILTMYKDEYMFNRAMDAGVKGYVLKENAVTDILQGIRTVCDGHYYISPFIADYLVRRRGKDTSFVTKGIGELTQTERKILRLIADNRTSREVAEILNISYKTVENHRWNMCRKLDIHGPNALLKFALDKKDSI